MIRTVIVKKYPNKTNNCVLFVRSILTKLPSPMTSLAQKINWINYCGDPWKTAVIMKMDDPHGHVAIFTGWSVDENNNNVMWLH